MSSRREFLQMGVAALALPISAHAALSPTSSILDGDLNAMPLYKVVFDERFSASRAFAEEAERLGQSVHGIKGDMTELWYHDLHARWTEEPVAIAGLTAHGPIFCLERLAWDHRMRVVFRVDHRYRPDGSIEHAISGPSSMLRRAAALSDEINWSSEMANLVTRCPAMRSQTSQSNVIGPTAKRTDDPEHLISWVIAPVHRA